MFIVAIRRTGAETPAPIAGLKYERLNFGQYFVCDFQYDASHFQLDLNNNELRLIDTALSDREVCRLKLLESEGIVSKSLMFGLPIYYIASDSAFVVSTHVRFLRRCGITLEEDSRTLPEYFVYRYVAPPKTLYKGVKCIPIGGTLRFRLVRNQVKLDDVEWTNVFSQVQSLSLAESVAAIADDLTTGTQDLEPRREQVGCLLSGGVDSSMLYKLAKDYLSLNESHSTGYSFEDPANNGERIYAKAAAETFGSTHHYHIFSTYQFLHALIDAIDHAEIPVVHLQSVLIELLFGQALGPRNRIVLNGQGADAIFGSTMMWWYQKYHRLIHSPFAQLMGILGRTPANRSFPYRKLYAWSRKDWSLDLSKPNHAIWLMGEVGEKTWVKEYFQVSEAEIVGNRMAAIRHFDPASVLDAFSILDFISDVDVTQVVWGQIAVAHGRRVHYSFNSPGLINAAANTPWEEKLAQQKRLGRLVAERIGVPHSILARPKLSFGLPSARWAAPGGVIEPILKIVASEVDVELLRQFQGSDDKKAMIYWGWINYAIWKRLMINGESSEALHAELTKVMEGAMS